MRKLAVCAPILLAVVLLSGHGATFDSAANARRPGASRLATIAYVVDGDTLRVHLNSRGLVYVRLVGIDTPEDVKPGTSVECGAQQAAASMRHLAPEGAVAVLRVDSVADEYDRYGRLLAHVFVGGRQLELIQLSRGWAEVYRYHHQRFDGLAAFLRSAAGARRADRGVWGVCGGDFHSSRLDG
jgi:micrococcal nuclease